MAYWNNKKVTYKGAVIFKYNDESYCAEVSASADWYHQDCVMYFKDGSGQPEMDDFEIDTFEVSSLINEDTQTDCFPKYNQDADFRTSIDDEINDALIDMDGDKWEGDSDDYSDFD